MSDAPAAADANEAARKAAEAERVEAEAKAEEAKAAGNACFAQGQFELAIEHFSNVRRLCSHCHCRSLWLLWRD